MGIVAKIAARPAVREAAGVLVNIAVDRIKDRKSGSPIAPSTGEKAVMVNEAATAIASRPELVNAMNAEPWYQSRVIVGLGAATAGFLLDKFGVGEENRNFVLANLPLLLEGLGLVIGAIGRTVKGLKPMTWNPLSWIGLGR